MHSDGYAHEVMLADETASAGTPAPTPEGVLDASSLPSKLAHTLSSLALEYRRLGAEIDERKESQAAIKESIESLVLPLSCKKVVGLGWSAIRTSRTTKSLNSQKVVEESIRRGLDPVEVTEIIAASTEEKRGKEYVEIRAGEKADKEAKLEVFG